MRAAQFLAIIGRGSKGSNALEVTEDRAAVTAESQDNIINRVNNVSQYGPSWHYVPGIGVAGTAYAEVPGTALGDLAYSRASSKTRTNAAGVVETIGNNVPPHDYRNADGTLSSFPRLNQEPQRTNSIRNSTMVGAVAGSPGTLPTNWSFSSSAGLTTSIAGLGTENGLQYIDIRFNGVATGTSTRLSHTSEAQIAALNAQVWSLTNYLKIVSQPNPPIAYFLRTTERNSSGVVVTAGAFPVVPTTSLQRFVYVSTLNGGATTAFVVPELQIQTAIGATYDFTIRIAAPQMELGAYATTFIPTTTAAVTRVADLANKSGISSLIGQTEGTIYTEVYIGQLQGAVARTFIDVGSIGNRIFLGFTTASSNTIRLQIDTALASAMVDFRSVVSSAGTIKVAAAYKNGDCALYVNGVAGTIVSNGSISFTTLANLVLGQTISGTALLNDSIAQAALFPTRLTNAQLAAITTL